MNVMAPPEYRAYRVVDGVKYGNCNLHTSPPHLIQPLNINEDAKSLKTPQGDRIPQQYGRPIRLAHRHQ